MVFRVIIVSKSTLFTNYVLKNEPSFNGMKLQDIRVTRLHQL